MEHSLASVIYRHCRDHHYPHRQPSRCRHSAVGVCSRAPCSTSTSGDSSSFASGGSAWRPRARNLIGPRISPAATSASLSRAPRCVTSSLCDRCASVASSRISGMSSRQASPCVGVLPARSPVRALAARSTRSTRSLLLRVLPARPISSCSSRRVCRCEEACTRRVDAHCSIDDRSRASLTAARATSDGHMVFGGARLSSMAHMRRSTSARSSDGA